MNSASDDYIIIENNISEPENKEEDESVSMKTLNKQGVFPEIKKQEPEISQEIKGVFSQDLLDQGGIEIIPSEERGEDDLVL